MAALQVLLLLLVSNCIALPISLSEISELIIPGSSVKKTNYDEDLAKQLLNLAAAAYGDEDDVSISCTSGAFGDNSYEYVSMFADECDRLNTVCSGYLVKSTKDMDLVVVFRGTRTNAQLLAQGWNAFNQGTDFYGMGKVNKYFVRALESLYESVRDFVTAEEHAGYTVKVTGHSLGGALASLCAAALIKDGLVPASRVALYTFGQPRVGNGEFAVNHDALGMQSFRVVFREDIVPHLPFCNKDDTAPDGSTIAQGSSRPCEFSNDTQAYHHGTEIWYPESMLPGSAYMECTGEPKNEDFECSDKLVFKPSKTSNYVWDHRNYFGVMVTEYGKDGCPVDFPQSTDSPNRDDKPGFLGSLFDGVVGIFQG